MKNNYIFICLSVVLFLSGLTLTACSSDSDDFTNIKLSEKNSTQGYVMTINATKGSSSTTRALVDNGTTLTSIWTAGDEVKVKKSGKVIGTLVAQNSGATTTLTGTLTTLPSVGDYLYFDYLAPDYSTQDGTLTGSNTSIDKVCDYAEASATVESIEGDKITLNVTSLSFMSWQSIVKFTLKDKETDEPLNVNSLIITPNGETNTITPSSPSNQLYAAIQNGLYEIPLNMTAIVGDEVYSYRQDNVTFNTGYYYTRTVKMSKDNGIDFSDVTDKHKGWFIGQNAKVYRTKEAATAHGTTPVACIAYVGTDYDGYCSKFLAIALEDVSKYKIQRKTELMSSSPSNYVQKWMDSHIVEGYPHANYTSDTDYYDGAAKTGSGISPVLRFISHEQGWRVPSVMDWYLVYNGLGGVPIPSTLTTSSPSGWIENTTNFAVNIACHGGKYGTSPSYMRTSGPTFYWTNTGTTDATWNFYTFANVSGQLLRTGNTENTDRINYIFARLVFAY